MALTRLPSFTLLTTDDFTFGNVTVSGNITASYLIGNGSQLTGLPASYTDTNANSAIDAKVTKAFIDNLNVDADTLDGLNSTYFATSSQGSLADSAVQPGDLATVATTGSYTDLINKPTLFDGTYANLTGKPTLATVATSGSYTDLTNKPTLFDGEYSSLANKPSLFDGTYANLTGKPTLGTAAATDANAYATAAQGSKADTALQPSDLTGYATETYVTNAIANIPNPASVTVSSTAPASPIEGDLWLDSDTGEMSIYFGNAWVAPTTSVSTALTVTDNAQPNITSVGTLTGLTVNGNITANYFIGNGSQLTGLPAGYTDTNANAAIDARVTKTFVDNLGVDANTLNGHSDIYFATSTQGTKADTAVQPGDLATVATSGSYTDLLNKPSLFDGTYANLTGKPTLGTAAATDANAYATAAQGSKADTAIQSGANISVFTNDSGYLVAANLTTYATKTYVDNGIANLVASAPAALDTLNELATALGNDANYSTTITNALSNKLSTSAFTSTADTWLGTKSTSDVSEGTNLYYTVARANSAIDARVTKTFVDNLAVVANIANIAYSVTGSNVSGQVSNALVAGTVYTNAQPNITSLGALTSLSVTGTLSLGDITKLYIPGGTNNYILKTDGAGNLSWTAQASSGNASIGGSNTQIFFNDAGGTTLGTSINLTFNKTTNTLSTTNFVASGTTNLGAVGNITVTGGSANNYLKTDGAGSLSWGTLPTTSVTLDAFTGNGVQTAFTLTTTPTNKDYTMVVVAGIVQPKSTYSVSGTTLTFSEAPPNTAPVEVTTFNTGVSAPSSGGSGSGYTYQGVSANTTLAVATRYIVNTSSSALTLTLPSTANLGDEIGVIDGTGNADTHNITINPNGGNIMGASGNMIVSTTRAAFTLVYYNASQGWLLTQV